MPFVSRGNLVTKPVAATGVNPHSTVVGSDARPALSFHSSSGDRFWILVSLASVYLIWGSTYHANHVAIETIPPFLMTGMRFLIAGASMYLWLRLRGTPAPTWREWVGCGGTGCIMLGGGTGFLVAAQEHVDSGPAALTIATVTFWVTLFAWLFMNHRTSWVEWLGISVGFVALGFLKLGGELTHHPKHLILLMLSPILWSFASVIGKRVPRPKSEAMVSAMQMFCATASMGLASLIAREGWSAGESSTSSVVAMLYLATFGSLIGFNAFKYLLAHTRPALATSYAYVNPVIALFLGWWLNGEEITLRTVLCATVIIAAVMAISLHQAFSKDRKAAPKPQPELIPSPAAAGPGIPVPTN